MRADRVPVGRSGIIRVWRAAWAPMSGSSRQAWLTSTLRRIPRGMRVAPGRRVECRDRPRFAQPATAGMSRTTRARRDGDVRDRIDRQRRRPCGPAVPRCRAARPCRPAVVAARPARRRSRPPAPRRHCVAEGSDSVDRRASGCVPPAATGPRPIRRSSDPGRLRRPRDWHAICIPSSGTRRTASGAATGNEGKNASETCGSRDTGRRADTCGGGARPDPFRRRSCDRRRRVERPGRRSGYRTGTTRRRGGGRRTSPGGEPLRPRTSHGVAASTGPPAPGERTRRRAGDGDRRDEDLGGQELPIGVDRDLGSVGRSRPEQRERTTDRTDRFLRFGACSPRGGAGRRRGGRRGACRAGVRRGQPARTRSRGRARGPRRRVRVLALPRGAGGTEDVRRVR